MSKRNTAATGRRFAKKRLRHAVLYDGTTRDIPLAAVACPTPHKTPFANRPAARRALRRYSDWRRDELGRLPRPYLCACGRYHLGHLPASVVRGDQTRADLRAGEAA